MASAQAVPLIVGALVYVVIAGFFVAAVCGYMAGLIGSSNSPLSGVGILAVLGAALLLVMARTTLGVEAGPVLVAFALFTTAVVFAVATIANDNLQDLKTGQLVEASPWKQQVALIVGVAAGAMVIPPILDLLNHAYGFVGGPPGISGDPLPAPQATLISALAKGVLTGDLEWPLIWIGIAIGVGIIVVDEVLGLLKLTRLPPLSVGIGIYLPMSTTAPVLIGAILGWAYDKYIARGPHEAVMKRLGVLLASGLIVGESLMGVLLAGIIVATGKESPLALVQEAFEPTAIKLGAVVFAVLVLGLYAWVTNLGRRTNAPDNG
jgi:putative OPT family oligopeptide transporter